MREGYSAESFAIMQRMARSVMKRDTHSKCSLNSRRRIGSYNDRFLVQLLSISDKTTSEVEPE